MITFGRFFLSIGGLLCSLCASAAPTITPIDLSQFSDSIKKDGLEHLFVIHTEKKYHSISSICLKGEHQTNQVVDFSLELNMESALNPSPNLAYQYNANTTSNKLNPESYSTFNLCGTEIFISHFKELIKDGLIDLSLKFLTGFSSIKNMTLIIDGEKYLLPANQKSFILPVVASNPLPILLDDTQGFESIDLTLPFGMFNAKNPSLIVEFSYQDNETPNLSFGMIVNDENPSTANFVPRKLYGNKTRVHSLVISLNEKRFDQALRDGKIKLSFDGSGKVTINNIQFTAEGERDYNPFSMSVIFGNAELRHEDQLPLLYFEIVDGGTAYEFPFLRIDIQNTHPELPFDIETWALLTYPNQDNQNKIAIPIHGLKTSKLNDTLSFEFNASIDGVAPDGNYTIDFYARSTNSKNIHRLSQTAGIYRHAPVPPIIEPR